VNAILPVNPGVPVILGAGCKNDAGTSLSANGGLGGKGEGGTLRTAESAARAVASRTLVVLTISSLVVAEEVGAAPTESLTRVEMGAMVGCLAQQRATTHQVVEEMGARRQEMLRLQLEGTARTATEAAWSNLAAEVAEVAVRSAADWVMATAAQVAAAVGRAVFRL
jgi:hypothetical protein